MSQSASAFAPAVLMDLGKKIDQLSDTEILQIAGLFERVSGDAEAAKGLAMLRPRLRKLRPRRTLDARRVFCLPFEMLLDDDPAPADPIRRISRTAIAPVWAFVAGRLPAEILARVEQAAAAATSLRNEALLEASGPLWAEAGTVLTDEADTLAQQGVNLQWVQDIGGACLAHESILQLRGLLRFGGQNKPGEESAKQIAALVHNSLDDGADAGFMAALIAAAHFKSPGSLIAALVDNKVGVEPGAGQVVVKRLCDVVGGDLMREAGGLAGPEAGANPGALVAGMDKLASSLKALKSFADKTKDRELKLKVEQALLAARSTAVDEVLPAMQNSVGANLDQAVSKAATAETFKAAQAIEDNMHALRDARPSAEIFGIAPEVEKAVTDLLSTVRAKAESKAEGESSVDRTARMMGLARYVELLEGPDAAQASLNAWLSKKAKAA